MTLPTDRAKILRLAANTARLFHWRMQQALATGDAQTAEAYAAALREEQPALEIVLAVRVSAPKRRVA